MPASVWRKRLCEEFVSGEACGVRERSAGGIVAAGKVVTECIGVLVAKVGAAAGALSPPGLNGGVGGDRGPLLVLLA